MNFLRLSRQKVAVVLPCVGYENCKLVAETPEKDLYCLEEPYKFCACETSRKEEITTQLVYLSKVEKKEAETMLRLDFLARNKNIMNEAQKTTKTALKIYMKKPEVTKKEVEEYLDSKRREILEKFPSIEDRPYILIYSKRKGMGIGPYSEETLRNLKTDCKRFLTQYAKRKYGVLKNL